MVRTSMELLIGEAVFSLTKSDENKVVAGSALPPAVAVWEGAPWASLEGLLDVAILARCADSSAVEDIPYLRLPTRYPQVSANFTGGEVIAFQCSPNGKVSEVVLSQEDQCGILTAGARELNSLLVRWARERFEGATWQVLEWICSFALHQRWLRWSDRKFTIVLPEGFVLLEIGDRVFVKRSLF